MRALADRPRPVVIRIVLCLALAAAVAGHASSARQRRRRPPLAVELTDVRTYDGTGNNPTTGDRGATRTALIRTAPADYAGNGSGDELAGAARPNPRTISNLVVSQGDESRPSTRRLSDFVWAWGQFLDHDIDLSESGAANGTAGIEIEDPDDPLAPGPIPFSRSDFLAGTGTASVPRQQINEITAFIDASNVYGSDELRAAALRSFEGGRMLTGENDLLPFNEFGLDNAGGPGAELFVAGDVRANENVVLCCLHTLFVREHNRLAAAIVDALPDADDEDVYQLARKIVGAEMQIVTYREFLPALLGPAAPSLRDYAGYDPNVDPAIRNEFSTAFYRFGHSLLPSDLPLGNTGNVLPLRDAFFNPLFLVDDPGAMELLLSGLPDHVCEEVDVMIVEDLRSFLFGPPGAGGLDLASLNIQRGRDHGLPDYNTIRVAYGLSPVAAFDDITSDAATAIALEELYGTVDDIDAWVGGLAEDHVPQSSVGPLLMVAIVDQFTRLRDGDRFFFLNDRDLDGDLVRRVVDLDSLRLADVIRANTNIETLPPDLFIVGGRPRDGGGRSAGDDRRRDRRRVTTRRR